MFPVIWFGPCNIKRDILCECLIRTRQGWLCQKFLIQCFEAWESVSQRNWFRYRIIWIFNHLLFIWAYMWNIITIKKNSISCWSGLSFKGGINILFPKFMPNYYLKDYFKPLGNFLLTKLDLAFLFAFGVSACQRLWLTNNLLWSQRYSHCFHV